MNITLTNTGEHPLPYASSKGGGFVTSLAAGASTTTDAPDITVSVVGDKPDFLDELSEAAAKIADLLKGVVTFWRDSHALAAEPEEAYVSVSIANHGPNALRVILGDPTDDVEVAAGETYNANALDYIEIRELGV